MKEKKAISKSLGKIVTGCIIGTVAFMGQKIIAEASELPIAGIDLVLCAFYENEGNKGKDVIEYLNSKELSEHKDLGFAQVSYYLNVRSKASEEGKILGKLYNNSAATIISKKGDWFKVKSGSVIGYVGTRIATVNTETLKVRKSASLDAIVLSLAPIGEELSVKKEGENWVKISDDNGSAGYVAAEYVDISTEFEDAVSIEEEQERLADEEAARQQNNNSGQITSFSIDSNSGCSSVRNNIADYALKFLGNSYVFGGTSLTNGTDCSGFSQSVFRHFGLHTTYLKNSGSKREICFS
jgi:SH3-like domain-containing protein